MPIVLGLDISTSCTGVCVLDSAIEPDDKGSHILLLDHVDFKGCKTFFDKADAMASYLTRLYASKFGISRVAVEEPLLGFSKGSSSASTITTLMRFNGIVSYAARNTFSVDPEYFSAAHARKLCGIKLQRTSVAGMSQKEQVFLHMSQHDLRHVTWKTKKSGQPIDASRDMTDAYVIARAASLV